MPKRPWASKRIDELEHIFKSFGMDPVMLHSLENELAYRQSQRATTLLAGVRRRLCSPELSNTRVQESLLGPPNATGMQISSVPEPERPVSGRKPVSSDGRRSPESPQVIPVESAVFPPSRSVGPKSVDPVMTAEEACRLLKVTLQRTGRGSRTPGGKSSKNHIHSTCARAGRSSVKH
jgi:hypothetical protein